MQLRRMPGSFARAARLTPPTLSPVARVRLQALAVWQQTRDWRVAAQVFGLSRATLFRWRLRYVAAALSRLESQSRRPHHVGNRRRRRLRDLRLQYPRWRRENLRMLLRREGIMLSAKTIGRVLARLRATGQLVEPPHQAISAPRCPRPRPYAVRKPRDYVVTAPGDLVQVDTLDVRPLPGVMFKQFAAREVVSRWDVVETYRRATSVTAIQFLATLQRRMPVPIRAIQVDGGSEFAAAFEQACQQQGIRLFVLPPRSPKLNGAVERANRTHMEEFYELYTGELDLSTLRSAQRQWEYAYNYSGPIKLSAI